MGRCPCLASWTPSQESLPPRESTRIVGQRKAGGSSKPAPKGTGSNLHMVEFINFYFIPGLVLGCIYAMGAIGITLLFGILKFAHFAHGDLITLGASLLCSW